EHLVALPLGVQHTAQRDCRIPDLLSAADREPAFAGLTAAIHIAVAHAPPLVRSALLFEYPTAVVYARRTHEVREVEIIGEPIDAHATVLLELVDEVLREIGVRALVVDIDGEGPPCGHDCTWRISFDHRSSTGKISSALAAGSRTFIRAMPRSRYRF